MSVDFSEFIDGGSACLGADTPLLRYTEGVIEITLNYPRTDAFKKADSKKQQKLYERLYGEILKVFPVSRHIRTFEFCQSGHVHLHAQMFVKHQARYTQVGVLADIVKSYIRCLPKRYSKYVDNNMKVYDESTCYKSPSILARYIDISDHPRILKWEGYINKNQ